MAKYTIRQIDLTCGRTIDTQHQEFNTRRQALTWARKLATANVRKAGNNDRLWMSTSTMRGIADDNGNVSIISVWGGQNFCSLLGGYEVWPGHI